LKAKNKTRQEVREDVNALLAKLKLSEKKNVLPSKLSGGQQRRLCLGMALIGNASVCFNVQCISCVILIVYEANLCLDYNSG